MNKRHEIIDWALEQELPSVEKLTLVTIAAFTHPLTGLCTASYASIAKKSGFGVSTVKKHAAALKETYLIASISRYNKNGGKEANNYIFPAYLAGV